jgi:hypothetical protein
MNKPVSMSIIVVDLGTGFPPSAQVTFGHADGTEPYHTVKFDLEPMDDATDIRMWAQMAAARVCDGL